jgi:hypothetical protein
MMTVQDGVILKPANSLPAGMRAARRWSKWGRWKSLTSGLRLRDQSAKSTHQTVATHLGRFTGGELPESKKNLGKLMQHWSPLLWRKPLGWRPVWRYTTPAFRQYCDVFGGFLFADSGLFSTRQSAAGFHCGEVFPVFVRILVDNQESSKQP